VRTATAILAAGFGTRMKSDLPKVLHPLAGRPLVEWSVRAAEAAGTDKPVVVVGHGREQVRAALGDRVDYAVQDPPLGTGHAVMQVADLRRGQADALLVVYADMPLLQAATLQGLVDHFAASRGTGDLAMAMLTIRRDDPQGFGRIVRSPQGEVEAVVEEVDCTPAQRDIRELNPGIYCFDAEWLWENLPDLPLSRKGEYYLTDLVGMATARGRRVASLPAPEEEVYGINDRVHLATAAQVLRRRILERHMRNGVTIVDPATTYVDDSVEIGQDTTILPGSHLQGQTQIGAHCVIGPSSQIVDCRIGDRCRAAFSVLEQARMDDGSEIGPFGHLRKGAHLGENVHMGNFGEVKNSYLGPGTKMGHFSYVGDTHMTGDVNVGAGTITCNYDGQQKHRTVIEKGVFLGSGTLLVAPVRLGAGARTGAGAVVTRDVPDDTLVYGVPARPALK
jgi:bifunctional UDP-N-acetylglucosamine pyrophosphorylase / glucosamine-1-phosphate N-acetyltransferase